MTTVVTDGLLFLHCEIELHCFGEDAGMTLEVVESSFVTVHLHPNYFVLATPFGVL